MNPGDDMDRRGRSQVLLERAHAALRKSSVVLANARSLLDQPIDGDTRRIANETTPALGRDDNVW